MNDTLKFPTQPATVPIVGQPFTLVGVMVPVNVVIRCNCTREGHEITMLGSQPGTCPACGHTYQPMFQVNGQLQMGIAKPEVES